MAKEIKYQNDGVQPCYPGKTGWEFLPTGYTGEYYSRILKIKTRWQTYGHGNRPVQQTPEQALNVLIGEAKNKGLTEIAVRFPEGDWRVIKI
jgi:hypothetical protein